MNVNNVLGGICQTHFEYNDMFLCFCSLLFLPIFRKYIGLRIDTPAQEDARDGEDAIVADTDSAAAYNL